MEAGRRLADRYEIGEVVAKGGMGVVWLGRDLRLGRPVAIKLVSGEALADPTVVARFDREASTVARLNHPNIVAVYDVGTDGADSFLVMEFVDGSSIAAAIGDGPLPVDETVDIAAQACAGLAAAHAAGVVHRDVKPANLIRTPDGVVKVCDFGIARLQDAVGQASLTGTAIALGSTSYMSPEQVSGNAVDARADLYGLGCTIHAMLTGRPPFVGDSPLAVVHQHVTQPPPDVRAVRPDVPAPLATLVGELLAKSPDDRPASAASVATRLAAMRAAATVPEAPPPGSGPPGNGHRRWLWGLAAGGCAALAAIIVTSFLVTGDEVPTAVSTPSAPTSPAVTASAVPATAPAARPSRTTQAPVTPTPTPSAAASSSPPPAPREPIAGLRLSIRTQVAAGHLAEAAAPDLNKRVDDIAKRLREGNDRDAAKKIKELRTKLADLHREGRLTQPGYDALVDDVDRVAALVPSMPPAPPKP